MPAVRSRGRTEDAVPKPRADAYVGLLGLSLLALFVAMLFAYLSYDAIKAKPPALPALPAAAARVPAGQGAGAGTPAGGQMQPGNVPPAGAPGGKATPPQKK